MTTPSPAAEFEKRMRWGAWPTVLFIANLVALTAAAIVSLTMRPRHPMGLPEDAAARESAARLIGRVPVASAGLRFRASVLGGEVPDRQPGPAERRLADSVRVTFERLRRLQPFEPRVHAALAALDLVQHRDAEAAAGYRWACELAPHYGEARLGLGVALARLAEREPGLMQQRALRLAAVAQFAAVDSVDAEYPLALANRALLLSGTGPRLEAVRFATAALAREPDGPHAASLRAVLSAGR
jgi:hypothetical protein